MGFLSSSSSALRDACRNGHEQRARALIKKGAALDWANNKGWTALMWACYNDHEQCARALIENGADIEKPMLPVLQEQALPKV